MEKTANSSSKNHLPSVWIQATFTYRRGRGGTHYGTNQWLSRTAKGTNQLLSASAGQAERCNSRKQLVWRTLLLQNVLLQPSMERGMQAAETTVAMQRQRTCLLTRITVWGCGYRGISSPLAPAVSLRQRGGLEAGALEQSSHLPACLWVGGGNRLA